jgi:hypothetical protein
MNFKSYLQKVTGGQVRSHNRFIYRENKTYIKDPSKAPAGANVQKGPRGGYYYDDTGSDNSQRQEEEKPLYKYTKSELKFKNIDNFENSITYDEDVLNELSFENKIINIDGEDYYMTIEGWYDDCLESRNMGQTNEKSVNEKYLDIMKNETGLRPDLHGYIPESKGGEYGVSYIAQKIPKQLEFDDSSKKQKTTREEYDEEIKHVLDGVENISDVKQTLENWKKNWTSDDIQNILDYGACTYINGTIARTLKNKGFDAEVMIGEPKENDEDLPEHWITIINDPSGEKLIVDFVAEQFSDLYNVDIEDQDEVIRPISKYKNIMDLYEWK